MRRFKQRVIAKNARESGRVLLDEEPPGTMASRVLEYKEEDIEEAGNTMFAREIIEREREFLDENVEVTTEEIRDE